ncbi:MAG: bifunctional phosphoribosylaminoimidazolecarboxamide formyltransferase/IMP cyclohydrolase [bacterium]
MADLSIVTPIKRALISVSDKTGIVEFATELAKHGIELISTGGTANLLRDAGLPVCDVADVTDFPEMMDGRVKTLHPKIHGGLLALRQNEEHIAAMAKHKIVPIDLLIVNLYPFEQTIAAGADYETGVENIDIGGPAMIRAAAKNHAHVGVVTDRVDYQAVLSELNSVSGLSLALRQQLAAQAFARTAAYDAAIAAWLSDQLGQDTPRRVTLAGELKQTLRYGENPHQTAGFYVNDVSRPSVATAQQIQGKELSYNNINDTDAAFELIADLEPERPAVAIIKHANPCGVAQGDDLLNAYRLALRCDPVSAFGGIVALNGTLTGETAEEIVKTFTEVVIAPEVDNDALEVFAAKKNLRLLVTGGMPDPLSPGYSLRTVSGGFLYQSRDNGHLDREALQIVSKRQPSERELADMLLAFRIGKHVKSNAIIYVRDGATVGIGAGQMSRLDSSRIAARKAEDAAKAAGIEGSLATGSVVASDAFFPFADGLLAAAQAGATAVIQPGGSIKDKDVIQAADEAGLAMVFTGMRHFRH